MPTHTVVAGDCIASIAKANGFGDWENLWNHANNAALKTLRKNPNMLKPGDSVFIPDPVDKKDDAPTDTWNKYKIPAKPTKLKLRFLKEDNKPLRNKPYKLEFGTTIKEGTTNGSGQLEQQIPADLATAQLTIWPEGGRNDPGLVYQLTLGTLEPHDEIAGAQSRLNNLGFFAGPVDGTLNPQTVEALRAFQHHESIAETGAFDAATQTKLREIHDKE